VKGKRINYLGIVLLTAFACVELGCIAPKPMPSYQYYKMMGKTAGVGESEIIVTCFGDNLMALRGAQILVNGHVRFTFSENNMTGTVIVPDGKYIVDVNHPQNRNLKTNQNISINANSSRIVLSLRYIPTALTLDGLSAARLELKRYTEVALNMSKIPPPKELQISKAEGLETAIKKAISSIISEMPNNSKIAVVNISSSDTAASLLVINELEYYLVSAKSFTIVDRSTLDVIRKEQKFQMSGAISDKTVVAVGNLSGANVVITGSIIEFGESHRLSLKALDVMTGQIIAMERIIY
jgi:hypothetical protein